MRRLNVLIAGRSNDEIRNAEALLEGNRHCKVRCKIITNGHTDPLHGLNKMPDLMLLCDFEGIREIESLAARPADERPELIVFGRGDDPETMRMAMRAGATDYLTLPLDAKELEACIDRACEQLSTAADNKAGGLHVFINGKGGSGATFLATNVAHGLATNEHDVTLVDLDLQYAGLCRYLDVKPARDLLDAVKAVGDMDQVSAEAYTTQHESGLRILAGKNPGLRLTSDISPEQLVKTLMVYRSYNDFVIVDLPRHLDMLAASVLDNADQVSVVTQQSFPHLHDTSRLLQILRNDIGVHDDQLTVVVNRYEKDSAILLKDIENALQVQKIVRIPNQYRLTSESVNTGVPLSEMNRRASVTKGLKDLYQSIGGLDEPEARGAARTLHSFFRR